MLITKKCAKHNQRSKETKLMYWFQNDAQPWQARIQRI